MRTHTSVFRRAALLTPFVAALACSSDEDGGDGFRITDQSGAEFFWVCDEVDDDCDIHRIAGVSPDLSFCGSPDGRYSYHLGRFIGIQGVCPFGDSGSAYLWEERLLVCESDEDCPDTMEADFEYECRADLCQNTDLVAYPPGMPALPDAWTLCAGTEPRSFSNVLDGPPEDPLVALIDAGCSDQEYPFEPCESLPAECIDPS